MAASKSNTVLLLAFILLLGLVLRYHHLDKESIWTDEAITMREAKKGTLVEIKDEVIAMEVFPPGYPIVMHYWITFFGDSEFSLRLPSLLFGMASIVLIFLIASQLFGMNNGLLSAFFMATGMLQVVFSQEARLYSIFGFLSLLSTYILIKWMKADKGNVWLGAYIITTAAACYVNYLTIFLIILHILVLHYNGHNTGKMIFPVSALLGLCFPLIEMIIEQFRIHHARWTDLLVSFGFPTFFSKIGLLLFAMPMVAIIALAMLVMSKQPRRVTLGKKEQILIALGILIAGAAYISLLDVLTRSFVLIRHSYFLVPVVYVGLAKFIESLSSKKAQTVLIILIILFNAGTLSIYYQKTTKPDWKSAADFVAQDEMPTVLFSRAGSSQDIFEYYFGDNFRQIDGAIDDKTVLQATANERAFWLVLSNDKGLGQKLTKAIEQKYTAVVDKSFVGIEVYYYIEKDLNTQERVEE